MKSLKIQRRPDKHLGTQFREMMLSKIKNREWAPGSKLPSIRKLEAMTGISLGIIRREISGLAKDGYLKQHQGKGVYVYPPLNAHKNVAVVLPDIHSEHITYIVRGIKAELDKYNTGLVLESARNDFSEEIKLVDKLDRGITAGAIIYPPPLKSFSANLQELEKRKIPFVLVNSSIDDDSFSVVSVDYFQMGQAVVQYLLERGHKNIGIIGSRPDVPSFDKLYAGMEYKLNEYGLSLNGIPKIIADYPQLNPNPFASPQNTVMKLLELDSGITAVLSTSENSTLEAYLTLRNAGIKIPDELSLISLGDMSAFNVTDPGITVVTQPYEEIGRLSVQNLFNRFFMPQGELSSLSVRPISIERGSVKNICR